uniref:Uncharacterized protein n=1 Tax=Timema tahoe TaxID=61484 RepID=A0A7R9P086_9NEOP|nr:unnamed protein product [Timema tahoe]
MAQLAAWLFADLDAWDYHRMPSIPEIPTTQKEVFATPLILCAITPQALIGDIISHLDNIDALMDKATDLRLHRLVTSQDVEQGLHQLRVTSSPQNTINGTQPSSLRTSGLVDEIGISLPKSLSLRIVEEIIKQLRCFYCVGRELVIQLWTSESDRDAQSWLEEQVTAFQGRLQDHGVGAEDKVEL